MFVWAPIPEPYQEMGSLEFASILVQEAEVATSPGIGFGEGGDGFVRFALIENEQRINQAVRNLRKALAEALRRPAPPVQHRCGRTTESAFTRGTSVTRFRSVKRWSTTRCGSGCPTAPARSASWRAASVPSRGDVVGIEILERGAGRAIDD